MPAASATPGSPLAPLPEVVGVEARALRREVPRLLTDRWATEPTGPVAEVPTIERLEAAVHELAGEVERLKHARD